MKICRCSIIYGLMILILSCTPDVTTERADENGDSGVERAVLTIRLGNGSDTASSNGKAMTVVPSPSLIKSYRVTMTNGSVTKTYDMDTSSETFYDLPTGSWNITVNGYSAPEQSGSVIASGTATATLAAGGNSVNITMSFMQTAVTGMGSYSLTVEFPAGAADGLTYSFNGGGFTTADLTGSPTATATITGSNITSGSYDLVLKFTKGGATTGVYREAVNIYDNVPSNKWINPDGSLADKRVFGSSDFADTNASLADLKLTRTINSSPSNLSFGFTSADIDYTTGGPFEGSNVTLQPTGSVAGQYIQYKVGTGALTQIKSGQTLAIGGSLPPGATTDIVVIVTAPDGVSAKEYKIHYDRVPPAAPVMGSTLYADGIASNQVKLRWTEPADSDYAGMIVSYGSPATADTTDKGTTSYLTGSLIPAITSFSVKSFDLYGNESAPVTINRPADINFTFKDFNNANKTMTLTWGYISGAKYEIEYTDSVTHIVTSTSETCTVTGLKGGYRYAFTVRAVYSYGKSYGNTTNNYGNYYCAGNNPLNVTAVTAGAGQSITVSGTLPADPNITGVTVTYNGTDTTSNITSGIFSVTTTNFYNTLYTTISYKVNYNNSGAVFSGDPTSKAITTWSSYKTVSWGTVVNPKISKLCINPLNNSPYLVYFTGDISRLIHSLNGTSDSTVNTNAINDSPYNPLLAIAPNGTIYQGLVTDLGYGGYYGKYIYRGSDDISSFYSGGINSLNVTIDTAPSGSAYLTDIDSSNSLNVYKKPAGNGTWVALTHTPPELLSSISDAVVKCAPDGTPWLVVHQKIGTAPTYVRVYRFSNVWVEVGSSFHNYGGGNIKCLPVFDTSGTPYIIGNFNMFKYNGSGWENPPLGSISCIPTSIVASPDTSGVLYFSCEYGTDFRVYKYTDGAANPLTLMGSFSDYKQDGSVAVAPDGTLYAAYVTTGDAIAIWKL